MNSVLIAFSFNIRDSDLVCDNSFALIKILHKYLGMHLFPI